MSSISVTCTRKIEFDAAHRVRGHQGKCQMLHGHRYVIEATFTTNNLSEIGMVLDFSLIKQKLGHWVDTNWDHNTILHVDDSVLGQHITQYTAQQVYYMNNNPTAENMSYYLLETICPILFRDDNIKCIKIKIYETPNCYAEACIY